jgi:cytidylate kinase
MKNLIVVIGPPAVGKMTVGQALSDQTGYPLLHNHVSIEVALRFFEFGTDGFKRISSTIRETVFDVVADSELPGLIFTLVWAFNDDSERESVERMAAWWRDKTLGQVYFLELAASEKAKRERNRHPDRLDEKPSKRDVDRSEQLRRTHEDEYQFNSEGAFPLMFPHLVVDNTHVSPDEVATQFLRTFELG